ncbi:MAG: glycine betaine ABC transporter substrate-binding protein, partial [Planctomycetia bacterium]
MTHIKSTGTGGRTGTIAREHAGRPLAVALAAALLIAHGAARAETAQIRVGSKPFTEGIVLGEVLVEIARQAGFAVEHRGALGGTQIVFAALERGEIDCYVEYSGTLEGEI